MRVRIRRQPVALGILAIFSAGLLQAQFEYGEVLGTVRDVSGAAVSGAKIVLHDTETNVERTAQTNDQGAYSFPGLRAGSYTVSATLAGFRPAKTDYSTCA